MSDPTQTQLTLAHLLYAVGASLPIIGALFYFVVRQSVKLGEVLTHVSHVPKIAEEQATHRTAISLLDARTRKPGDPSVFSAAE